MKLNDIAKIIEGTLFVAGDSLDLSMFVDKYGLKPKEIDQIVAILKEKNNEDSGINILHFNNKLQLCSNPEIVEEIADFLNPIREKALTRAALETIAIIAYKEPITKSEIENIRGVKSCDYAMQVLLSNDLVKVVGRKDAIGKPLLYATTDNFLKRFELNSLEDLPDAKTLMERIRIINVNQESLYKDFEISDEKIVSEYDVEEIHKEPEDIFSDTFKNVDNLISKARQTVKEISEQEQQAEEAKKQAMDEANAIVEGMPIEDDENNEGQAS